MTEPAISLLDDAGLGPEEPGERALAFPCRNAPVDVLLVRAADVPEYVVGRQTRLLEQQRGLVLVGE